ncbi:MAG TPA: hypothetical protein VH854_09235 [Thermoanaerobaculia bacterium]|nr:hypothetical protein [Thermoanaerobaculia bacterium]
MIAPALVAIVLLASPAAAPEPAPPLACRLDALTAAQRERHRSLSEKLVGAVVSARELADGWEISLDLSKIRDAKGSPYCVIELAEWVDLESRCCPFVDFGIDTSGRGGPVRLRLTGAEGVKELIASEVPMLARK